ncbi:MAG TPA: hypothetical protein VFA33_26080 [Bryobacteraceae bacterium]|nr:hypothetical protein [Bryobacteraceae bacterium]
MTLAELRRASVRKGLRIRFPLSNGMECVINEHGIAQVPALRAAADFNLEEQVAQAQQFVVEPASSGQKHQPQPRRLSREQLAAFTAAPGAETAHAEDHDE